MVFQPTIGIFSIVVIDLFSLAFTGVLLRAVSPFDKACYIPNFVDDDEHDDVGEFHDDLCILPNSMLEDPILYSNILFARIAHNNKWTIRISWYTIGVSDYPFNSRRGGYGVGFFFHKNKFARHKIVAEKCSAYNVYQRLDFFAAKFQTENTFKRNKKNPLKIE